MRSLYQATIAADLERATMAAESYGFRVWRVLAVNENETVLALDSPDPVWMQTDAPFNRILDWQAESDLARTPVRLIEWRSINEAQALRYGI
jgi:hypothetical protein